MLKWVAKKLSWIADVVVGGRQDGAGLVAVLVDVVLVLSSCAWLCCTWDMGKQVALFGYVLLVVCQMWRLRISMEDEKFNNLGGNRGVSVRVVSAVFAGVCYTAAISSVCGLVVISVQVVNWGVLSHVADILFWACLVSFALATLSCTFLMANYEKAKLAVA